MRTKKKTKGTDVTMTPTMSGQMVFMSSSLAHAERYSLCPASRLTVTTPGQQ